MYSFIIHTVVKYSDTKTNIIIQKEILPTMKLETAYN